MVRGVQSPPPARKSDGLMPTQRTILQMTADGRTQVEIGQAVGLAPQVVHNRLKYLVKTRGCRGRVHLIAHAIRQGWIE